MNKLGQLTIAEACIDDAPILLALMQAAFEEYEGITHPAFRRTRRTVDSVRARLTAGAAALARVGEEAAGFTFYEPAGDLVYLGRLSVLPRFRNNGIGGALVAYVGAPREREGRRRHAPRRAAATAASRRALRTAGLPHHPAHDPSRLR